MKNISRHHGILNIVERMNNSVNGNPRYRIFIADSSGNGVSCVTAPDSDHGYSITNFSGQEVSVTIGTYYGTATLNSIERTK
jgi:hypothetical protein